MKADPPRHAEWRRLLGAEFSPRATMVAQEAEVRQAATELVDERVDGGCPLLRVAVLRRRGGCLA
ncbi:hypothetical protein AB0G32_13180 [Streptomyces sp. NPDC023723]|uniref:hypothetical protein n=1 Tax=Streptomyces sp. NPDC023723 TaxID=3154323 RepID=UPI0033F75796